MKYRRLIALLALAAGPACSTEVATRSGEETFQQYCTACHGELGKGDGPVAEVLATPPPDLTRIAARNDGKFPREALVRRIDGRDSIDAHGSQQMPVWGYEFWIDAGAGSFSEQQVRETLDRLVDYLESIQLSANPAPSAPVE